MAQQNGVINMSDYVTTLNGAHNDYLIQSKLACIKQETERPGGPIIIYDKDLTIMYGNGTKYLKGLGLYAE
jgi:hypothetical protein